MLLTLFPASHSGTSLFEPFDSSASPRVQCFLVLVQSPRALFDESPWPSQIPSPLIVPSPRSPTLARPSRSLVRSRTSLARSCAAVAESALHPRETWRCVAHLNIWWSLSSGHQPSLRMHGRAPVAYAYCIECDSRVSDRCIASRHAIAQSTYTSCTQHRAYARSAPTHRERRRCSHMDASCHTHTRSPLAHASRIAHPSTHYACDAPYKPSYGMRLSLAQHEYIACGQRPLHLHG
jgi:hypothetical protein